MYLRETLPRLSIRTSSSRHLKNSAGKLSGKWVTYAFPGVELFLTLSTIVLAFLWQLYPSFVPFPHEIADNAMPVVTANLPMSIFCLQFANFQVDNFICTEQMKFIVFHFLPIAHLVNSLIQLYLMDQYCFESQ